LAAIDIARLLAKMTGRMSTDEATRHLIEAHDASLKNRDRLADFNAECGCFYCCRTFPPTEVTRWVGADEKTALCPHCHIDAVVPQTDPAFLRRMREFWFEQGGPRQIGRRGVECRRSGEVATGTLSARPTAALSTGWSIIADRGVADWVSCVRGSSASATSIRHSRPKPTASALPKPFPHHRAT
jgi:hypothetical protein